uniref:Synaptogyrin 1 n=1 Tax=Papio anubis TaxID=9555 RepID=A0A2I3M421_PAPAN
MLEKQKPLPISSSNLLLEPVKVTEDIERPQSYRAAGEPALEGGPSPAGSPPPSSLCFRETWRSSPSCDGLMGTRLCLLSTYCMPGPWLFSIVVFGSIVNEGYLNSASEGEEFCIYNRNPNACSYGVAVGVLAFLTCLLYLALDVYFPQISSVKDRKKAVLSDIGVSAFWAFLWFVGFCYLANQWQVSKPKDNPLNEGTDAARAAIAFSFFSIFTWSLTAALAVRRFKDLSFQEEYSTLFPASAQP